MICFSLSWLRRRVIYEVGKFVYEMEGSIDENVDSDCGN